MEHMKIWDGQGKYFYGTCEDMGWEGELEHDFFSFCEVIISRIINGSLIMKIFLEKVKTCVSF